VKIIVGLGNPGKKYEYTRHNAGFLAVDHYMEGKEVISCESKFDGTICEIHFHPHIPLLAKEGLGAVKTFFVKPKTFMNESGRAVKEIAKFYKIDITRDLLVIHDEVDLPFGEIRTTHSSQAAGHNGVKSIIDALGTQDFHRARIGVETRESRNDMPTDAYVLSPFSAGELEKLRKEVFIKTDEIIAEFISHVQN